MKKTILFLLKSAFLLTFIPLANESFWTRDHIIPLLAVLSAVNTVLSDPTDTISVPSPFSEIRSPLAYVISETMDVLLPLFTILVNDEDVDRAFSELKQLRRKL